MATSREPSAGASSGGDTIDDQVEDVKPRLTDLDQDGHSTPEVSLKTQTPTLSKSKRKSRAPGSKSTARKPRGKKGSNIFIHEGPPDGTEDEGSTISTPVPRSNKKRDETPNDEAQMSGTAGGNRRQANGTVGSVYSGSKIRHIKKVDGTPLWRKEIQYEFLRQVIEDKKPVFTRISDGKQNCTFADIYIDCMARSSKTSKILKDRLQIDREAAQNMAMICLLVNVGRMNTTLNFFPEMRAQLRTYHSIPSLQAYKSQRDYKSLQDAPRLKSILKGASEDTEEPRTISALKQRTVPRTNPVNLIFIISQYAPKISETHFTDKVDFFDLTMRETITSVSRARAFLWLMWWYLESSFTKEEALNNPFGSGEYRNDEDKEDDSVIPLLVPKLTYITELEADQENVDTKEEIAFAEKMSAERKRIMAENAAEPPPSGGIGNPDHKVLKRLKKSTGEFGDDDSIISDADSRASPGIGWANSTDPVQHQSHVMGSVLGGQADSLDDDWEAANPHPGRGRYKRVRGKNTPSRAKVPAKNGEGGAGRSLLRQRHTATPDTAEKSRVKSTPQPLQPAKLGNHPVISQFAMQRRRTDSESMSKTDLPIQFNASGYGSKARARTGYQRELEEHRHRRIEWNLKKKKQDAQKAAYEQRETTSWFLRAARRIAELPADYDSEEEDNPDVFGFGGLVGKRPVRQTSNGDVEVDNDDEAIIAGYEDDDYGEEAEMWASVLSRAGRRLDVWTGVRDYELYHARIEQQNAPRTLLSRNKRTVNGVPKGRSNRAKAKSRNYDADVAMQDDLPQTQAVDSIPGSKPTPKRRGDARKAPKRRRGVPDIDLEAEVESNVEIDDVPEALTMNATAEELNEEIIQDLLAERSDEEMASIDEDEVEVENDQSNGEEDDDISDQLDESPLTSEDDEDESMQPNVIEGNGIDESDVEMD